MPIEIIAPLFASSALGLFVATFIDNVIVNFATRKTQEGVSGLVDVLKKRLATGKLAHNHDLEDALLLCVKNTFEVFCASCIDELDDSRPQFPGGDALAARAIDERLTRVTGLRRALHDDGLLRLYAPGLNSMEPRAAARFASETFPCDDIQRELVSTLLKIAAINLSRDGGEHSPHYAWLAARARDKWPAFRAGKIERERVTLGEVFVFFFREIIKQNSKVFHLITTDMLFELRGAATQPPAAADAAACEQLNTALVDALAGNLDQTLKSFGEKLDALHGAVDRLSLQWQLIDTKLDTLQGGVDALPGHLRGMESRLARKLDQLGNLDHLDRRGGRMGTVRPAEMPRLFLQRDDELAATIRALLSGGTKLVVLSGDPGIGKSAIAQMAWNHPETRACFNTRRWFVNCEDAQDLPAAARPGLLQFLADHLNIDISPSRSSQPPLSKLAAELNDGAGLLVLDNADILIDQTPADFAALLQKLRACDSLAVLLTMTGRWLDRKNFPDPLGQFITQTENSPATATVDIPPLPEPALRELFFHFRKTHSIPRPDPW